MELKKLWKISKYAYRDAFTQAQLEMAGSNKNRILENMEKNKNYMKTQNIVMKIVMVVYLGGMIFLPIQAFSQIAQVAQNLNIEWAIFTGSLTLGLFSAMQTLYMIMFGLFFSSNLLSGESFLWLHTLPLSRNDMKKISFFTFFRGIDVEVIMIVLSYPLGTVIATQNFFLAFIALAISIINAFFSLSLLAVLGKKIHTILEINNINSKKATFIRIGVLVGYVIMTMLVALIFQFSFNYITQLFQHQSLSHQTTSLLNYILMVIPFPFAGSYLLLIIFFQFAYFTEIHMILVGFGISFQLYITQKMVKNSLNHLIKIAKPKKFEFQERIKLNLEEIQIESQDPVSAWFNKDKRMATRDIQMVMYIIMPIILPIIGVISMSFTSEVDPEIDFVILFVNSVYLIMSGAMVAIGVLNVESTGATVVAALPVVVRNQAKGKIRWLFIILPLSSLIQLFLYLNKDNFWIMAGFTLVLFPFGPITGLVTLELKVVLFGKTKYKYVLEEINISGKVWKWILIITIDSVLYILLLIPLTIYMTGLLDISFLMVAFIYIGAEIFFSGIVYYIFNRMFPKPSTHEV